MFVSIISPIYQAELLVEELVTQIIPVLRAYGCEFEILLVEDGSNDDSWAAVQKISLKNECVTGIKLSRNFGQHQAVTAGIQYAQGDYIVVIDCDLQDSPSSIVQLLDKAKENFDVVFTKREKRNHGLLKSFLSWLYNRIFGIIAGGDYSIDFNSLVLMSKKAAGAYLELKDQDRLYIQLLKWVGFNTATIFVPHRKRGVGSSTYSFTQLFGIAIQAWTFHSDRLLKFSIFGGFLLSGASFFGSLIIVVLYFVHGFQPGWPSLFLVILFSTGLILLSIGVTGIYIGKIFIQVKSRPLFIVEETTNKD